MQRSVGNTSQSNNELQLKKKRSSPLKVSLQAILVGGFGGFFTIFALSLISWNGVALLMAPFGASCVLAFHVWDSPLSQPRNIIGGHFISTLVGLIVLNCFGNHAWTLALGVGLAIMMMILTKTTHPPAGADPIVVILAGSTWEFLFLPVLSGAILLSLLAYIVNNLQPNRKYPTFWV